MGSIFFELSVLICVSTFFALFFRLLRQPPILAYLVAGLLLGPLIHLHLDSTDQIRNLAQVGVALLLFIMGLELRLSDLRSIGLVILSIGALQTGITAIMGFDLALLMGFHPIEAIYIAIALTFSSTIIVVKLLSDKKDLTSLYGKLAVGLLLLQDLYAIIILILLSSFSLQSYSLLSFMTIGSVLVKGVLLFSVVLLLGKTVFPLVIHSIARSQELLFLFSLAWVFGLSSIVSLPFINYPIAIGGLLAGIALANSLENIQIAAKIVSLRDFFVTIFFVTLGMQLTIGSIQDIFLPIIIFILFVLLLKPLLAMIIIGAFRYRKRTSFLTAITTSQISEFSLIIIFLGARIGHVQSSVISLITITAIVTFAVSTYFMMYAGTIYKRIGKFLTILESSNTRESTQDASNEQLSVLSGHIILIGVHRMGESILEALTENKEQVIVVDFNPDIIKKLKANGIMCLFGDIADTDVQERVRLEKAKLIISTVPDIEDNLLLLQNLNLIKGKAKFIVIALDKHDAHDLYKAGADYVVIPHLLGGKHLAKLITKNLDNISDFREKEWEKTRGIL